MSFLLSGDQAKPCSTADVLVSRFALPPRVGMAKISPCTTNAYERALTQFGTQWPNSRLYGSISTILDFLIAFPVAYTIAFRGGRYKNVLLFLVIGLTAARRIIASSSRSAMMGPA